MRIAYPSISIARVCELFGKTRQAWYDNSRRKEIKGIQDKIVIEKVQEVREILPRLGGNKLYRMLKKELDESDIKLGRDAFFKVLKEYNLLVKPRKKYVSTTNSRHHFKVWSNLIEGVVPTAPEQIWVSDITYIRIKDGFVFLSLITDAYSRKIMGFHLSTSLKAQGSIRALQMAIQNRKYNHELIHHSDRGIQYCSSLYVKLLLNNNIAISMTQDGSPYDNAIAERVNGILKSEFNLSRTFEDYHDAIEPVVTAIHAYNNYRPHMSIEMLTPREAHQIDGKLNRMWKNQYQTKNELV